MERTDNILEIENTNPESGVVKYENRGFVKLPVCQEDFEEFICGLLGQPQSIEGRHIGEFEINLKTIENLHYLLQQRINQQNKNRLVQLIAKIMYKDNTSVTLNSFDELMTYNEVKPLVPVAVHLTWVYLVKFEDKKGMEKQVIDILFVKNSVIKRKVEAEFIVDYRPTSGYFEYSIKHTARSWGIDIEFLLTNHIKSLFKEPSKVKKFLTGHQAAIGFISGIFVFSMSVLGSVLASTRFTTTATATVVKQLKMNTEINDKIDYIANYIASGTWFKFTSYNNLFITIMIAVSVFLGAWVGSSLDINEPSFILLTDEAKKDKKKVEQNLKKAWLKFAASIIISILSSLVASYIFNFLSETKI